MKETAVLGEARHVLEYPYRRSVGPIMGRFFGGLKVGRILGVRTRTGRVLVPPSEYDPETGEAVGDFVEVGTAGVVTSWTWISKPREGKHPLQKPFAFALVHLDGADTALLHAVDAGSEARMKTGMRVRARFRDEPKGGIHDIACFVPEAP